MTFNGKLAFRPPTLREQVVNEIIKLILEGELQPGDHLREQELTKRLGISRTPLREAFIVLERDGLVVNYPNRGIFIRPFNEQDIVEIFQIRTTLENLAAELIITKLDERHYAELEHLIHQQELAIEHGDRSQFGPLDREFHYYFVSQSGNSRLISFWWTIAVQYSVALGYRTKAYPNYDEHQIIVDHRHILNAYKSGDIQRVYATNEEINTRVCELSVKAFQLQSQQPAGLKSTE